MTLRHRLRTPDHFGRLLTLLILDVTLTGLHTTTIVLVVNGLLGLLTVIVAVTATGLRSRIPSWQVAALITMALVSLVLGAIEGDRFRGISATAGAFALGVLVVAAMGEVLDMAEVEMQTLLGALCVYLLIGLLFARVFNALIAFSSDPVFTVGGEVDTTYFSFTTLTTVGYGDITAVGPLARRIAVVEGITGQVFLATAVARLVSLYRSPRERTDATPAGTSDETI